MARFLFRQFWRLAWWQRLLIAAATPLAAFNTAVSVCGHSAVFPLSVSFLPEKAEALERYAAHRPRCLFSGHPDLGPIADAAERDAGLPRGLMRAVIAVESEGEAHRISYAGAMGPAQLMPGTAAMLGVKDPFDPEQAIPAGARYLARLLRRFGDVRLAVAAYNAGPNAINGSVPHNGQTDVYVVRVMRELAALDHRL